MPELLYKYRSLENLERFLDIIIDKKLYGALYNEMNDPMEGYFQYDPKVDKRTASYILNGKGKRYICSLSRKPNIGLMWTHYAAENQGCCLEVEVTSKSWERLDIDYSEQIPVLTDNMTVQDVLKVKAKMWEYEQEVRYVSWQYSPRANRPKLSVRINKIIFGYKVKNSQYNHLKKVALVLNPKIKIEKLKKDELDYGFKWHK